MKYYKIIIPNYNNDKQQIKSFFVNLLKQEEIIEMKLDSRSDPFHKIIIKLKPKDFIKLTVLARKEFQKYPEVITAPEYAYLHFLKASKASKFLLAF